jgi:hypothetical protein
MVLLAHILKHSLSNSASSLTLIIESNQFTGLGKLFWLSILHSLDSPTVILSDSALQAFVSASSPVLSSLPHTFDHSLLSTQATLCIDNLEYHNWLLSPAFFYTAIKHRTEHNLPTVVVANSSYIDPAELSRFIGLASIVVVINSFDKKKGVAKCVHIRGYLKCTEEICGFEVEGEKVKEIKRVEKERKEVIQSTFRIGVSEEEKKVKDAMILPYEKVQNFVKIEEEDLESPDEEGDEDDYY